MITRRVRTSLRLQLIVLFLICVLASVLSIVLSSSFLFRNNTNSSYIDYNWGIDNIESTASNIVNNVRVDYDNIPENNDLNQLELIQSNINQLEYRKYKIMLIDQTGEIRAKSSNVIEKSVDLQLYLFNAINQLVEAKTERYNERQEYTTLRPIIIDDHYNYLIVSGIPEAHQVYYSNPSQGPMPFVIGIAVFFLLFYYLTKRKMNVIEAVSDGLLEISKGNLRFRLQEKSQDELGTLATHINRMAEELEQQIERERTAEKTKNELITNVSHDLRTPLTLIMGYLRALKDKKYENEAQSEEYLNIAYEKSEKLKGLLEDLFEFTKLNNDGMVIKKEIVSLNELIEQLLEEYVPICEENHLGLKRDIPAEKVWVKIDADQMVRVFENLLNNAISYSIRPSLIRVSMKLTDQHVIIQFRNNSISIPEGDLSRMFERFYRADSSRSSKTGGSGLGLAISKSIITLHDGEIWAEADEDTITIFVKLNRWQN